jgi:putative peptidoglycan lipid II flippase
MIKKLLYLPSKSITGAAIIISASTLISRLVGIVRDRVLAHTYGDGPVIDAYYAAFKIPDLIYSLLVMGALTVGFIPIFTKLFQKEKESAWKLAQNILTIIGLSLGILCTCGILFAKKVSFLIAPGFNTQYQDLLTNFTRIMFLSPFILGISTVMGGILQSMRQFLIYSLAPILYNLGIIFGITVLVPFIGITGLAWGVVLGALLHFFVQLYGAYHNGFRWKWYLNLKDSCTREVGRLMIPRTLGLAATQINTIIITMLASTLPIGSIAAYNYASNLQGVPVGLIGIPFALAVFPILSSSAEKKDKTEFNQHLSFAIRQIIFLIIPISLIFLLLRAQIVRVVLGTGAFDWQATKNTANALAFFSLSLFAQALIHVLARAFYALSNSSAPFIAGIISELVTVLFALLIIKTPTWFPIHSNWIQGVSGLALASSLGSLCNMLILFIVLRLKVGNLQDQKILTSLYKIIISGLVMGITVQLVKYPLSNLFDLNRFWGILLHGVVSGIIGLLTYIALCYILRVEELAHLLNSLKKRWLRVENLPLGTVGE